MILDDFYDSLISSQLVIENVEETKNHITSGRLSAGALGQPVQWQVLKALSVDRPEFDPYLLRKFARGKSVEDWFVNQMSKSRLTGFLQAAVMYREVVGKIDVGLTTSEKIYNLTGQRMMIHEVKSVANAKFKRLKQAGQPDRSHALQGALYALANGDSYFAIDYIASDDLRVLTWILKTVDYKKDIDLIIDEFNRYMDAQTIPTFIAKEPWQADPKYQSYPEWANFKTDKEATDFFNTTNPTGWEDRLAKLEKQARDSHPFGNKPF